MLIICNKYCPNLPTQTHIPNEISEKSKFKEFQTLEHQPAKKKIKVKKVFNKVFKGEMKHYKSGFSI